MRLIKTITCDTCPLKCDISLTAREMNIEHSLAPVHAIYKKRENICRQYTKVTHAYILVEGNAKMYITGNNNRNIILNILLSSNYIGLMSVYGSNDYQYSVAAITDCHTCQVDIRMIKEMYFNNHNFMLKLNKAFGDSVTFIMQKLISLNQKQTRGKVAESLLYLARLHESENFTLTLTRKELGEFSAISEENVVRVLSEFKNEGIVEVKGKELLLNNTEMLEKISTVG